MKLHLLSFRTFIVIWCLWLYLSDLASLVSLSISLSVCLSLSLSRSLSLALSLYTSWKHQKISSFLFIKTANWGCSVKKVFLEILQNSQENTCARVSFLIKLQALGLWILSCEFCKVSKNTFFTEQLQVAASINKNEEVFWCF